MTDTPEAEIARLTQERDDAREELRSFKQIAKDYVKRVKKRSVSEVEDSLNGTDWEELCELKCAFRSVMENKINAPYLGNLEKLLAWIDEIQQSAEEDGYPVQWWDDPDRDPTEEDLKEIRDMEAKYGPAP
jgi:hypothetical protein